MKQSLGKMLILVLVLCCSAPLTLADEPSPQDYATILKEYQMDFGKYSCQSLFDICTDESNPAFDYVYFGYSDENSPFDSYSVYMVLGENGDTISLKCNSDKYSDKQIELYFGITGYGDIAYPVFQIQGSDFDGKTVKEMLITAVKEYKIVFKDKEHSFLIDGQFVALSCNMFGMAIDILKQLASNEMELTIQITFSDGETLPYVLDKNDISDTNMAQYFLQALTDCGYLDKDDNIQSDIVSYFPEIDKEYSAHTRVTDMSDNSNKGYSSFGERYGISMTRYGSSGVDQQKRPWITVNVKNESNDKVIDGFDVVYYGETVYGDIITFDDAGAKLVYNTIVKNINPAKSYSTDRIFFYDPSQHPKTIYAAIRRVHFSDGTLIEIPLRDLTFYSFEIEY